MHTAGPGGVFSTIAERGLGECVSLVGIQTLTEEV